MSRYYLIIFVALISCAEPHHFDNVDAIVEVIDAKVSTIEGNSYVKVFLSQQGTTNPIVDLDIVVVSGEGDEYPFNYVSDSSSYLPDASDFSGEVGSKYKFEAYRSGVLIYESDYDSISQPIDFILETADTSVLTFNSINVVRENGTAVSARIASIPDLYSKFEFRYSYLDYFTEERVYVNDEEEFELYNCESNSECPDSTQIVAGLVLRDGWNFIQNTPLCNAVRDTMDDVKFFQECPFECCHFEDVWLSELVITSEALSPDVYFFWNDVEKLSGNDGLIFSTYPFPLGGNIRCNDCENNVLGLFRAVAETTKRKNVLL